MITRKRAITGLLRGLASPVASSTARRVPSTPPGKRASREKRYAFPRESILLQF